MIGTIILITWLPCFIISYYLIRRLYRDMFNEWEWSDVIFCSIFSLFGIASLIAGLIVWCICLGSNHKPKTKPPKWL